MQTAQSSTETILVPATPAKPATRFPSLAAWAKSVGSSAKTRDGQRKAILNSFPRLAALQGRGPRVTPGGADEYLRSRAAKRQQRFAAAPPAHLGVPVRALISEIMGGAHKRVSPLTLQSERGLGQYARVGGWTVRVVEEGEWDRDKYSKSWHNSHGGVWDVNRRYVAIRRFAADGTVESRDVDVPAWRGNYLLDALVSSGVLEAQAGRMDLRLHRAFGLEAVRRGRHLTILARTLAGETVDYVAVAGQVTYHAATVREAIAGLRAKIRRANLKAQGRLINRALGRDLGFCEAGMIAFASAVGLRVSGDYTAEQIAEAVRANPAAARPYRAELRTLAKAVGYDTAELASL